MDLFLEFGGWWHCVGFSSSLIKIPWHEEHGCCQARDLFAVLSMLQSLCIWACLVELTNFRLSSKHITDSTSFIDLRCLDVSLNHFEGPIPSTPLRNTTPLQHLDLSWNSSARQFQCGLTSLGPRLRHTVVATPLPPPCHMGSVWSSRGLTSPRPDLAEGSQALTSCLARIPLPTLVNCWGRLSAVADRWPCLSPGEGH